MKETDKTEMKKQKFIWNSQMNALNRLNLHVNMPLVHELYVCDIECTIRKEI